MALELPPGLDLSGQSGTVIWMLMTAISVMSAVIVLLYRNGQATTTARIEETKVFGEIVKENTLAHRESAAATQALAMNLKDVSMSLAAFASTQTHIASKVELHHENNRDRLEAIDTTVGALAGSVRTLAESVNRAMPRGG